jgi:hypothetical protein
VTTCTGGKGTGQLYSYAGLEGLWINAGGKRSLAPTMAAIAEAESGGCSTAYNASGATGLWQILGAVDPGDQSKLTDPAINAKEAVLKWQTQGLTAWTTYTSGAYKSHLRAGTAPNTNVPSPGAAATAAEETAALGKTCLVAFPGVPGTSWWDDIFGGGGNIGAGCLLSKSEGRALLGALIMVGGVMALGLGAVLLAAYGLKSAGAGRAAGRALEVGGAAAVVAGAPEAGAAIHRAGGRVRSQGPSRAATTHIVTRSQQAQRQQAATQRQAQRQQAATQRQAQRQQAATQRQAQRQQAATQRQQAATQRQAQRQQAAQQRKAAAIPQGRHAKAGPNAPAQGRHAAPQPVAAGHRSASRKPAQQAP